MNINSITTNSQIINSTQNNHFLSKSEKFKNIAIRILKVSVVALGIIALLAAAAASIYFAIPLFAVGGWAIIGGIALGGAGIGFVGGAILSPFLGKEKDKIFEFPCEINRKFVNTPMFKITQHNARDCIIHLGKTLAMGAGIGFVGAGLIPGLAAAVFLGGVFFYALSKSARP